MNTKLIFLDIDGVLVPQKKFIEFVDKENYLKFDPDCLLNFETVLRRYPEVYVVISSSWKEIFNFEIVQNLFSDDIAKRILGFTPFLDSRMIHDYLYIRHQEVLKYLKQHDLVNIPWIAIDDIAEHYPPNVNIIVTNAYSGFNESDAATLDSFLQTNQQ